MRNPAQALAEAVRLLVRRAAFAGSVDAPDDKTYCGFDERDASRCADRVLASMEDDILAAFDAWKPWEDEVAVERAAEALWRMNRGAAKWPPGRREGVAATTYRMDAARVLKAALGGDDA